MSGEEFEQAAEERALAKLCGSPLCTRPCVGDILGRAPNGVRPKPPTHSPSYCSAECAGVVRTFAARLGSTASATQRFELLMHQLKQQKREAGAPAEAAAAAARGPCTPASPAHSAVALRPTRR